eukprot:1117439-Amphidinium_carterae.1
MRRSTESVEMKIMQVEVDLSQSSNIRLPGFGMALCHERNKIRDSADATHNEVMNIKELQVPCADCDCQNFGQSNELQMSATMN